MATRDSLTIGQTVKVYDGPDGPVTGTIAVLQDDVPGKVVGVQMENHHPLGHSLDGAVAQGHGWWTTPEKVAIL